MSLCKHKIYGKFYFNKNLAWALFKHTIWRHLLGYHLFEAVNNTTLLFKKFLITSHPYKPPSKFIILYELNCATICYFDYDLHYRKRETNLVYDTKMTLSMLKPGHPHLPIVFSNLTVIFDHKI